MSFRCEHCKITFPVYDCPVRVVAETRSLPKPAPYADHMRKEIVREESLCGGCAYLRYPNDPEVIRQNVMREARERRQSLEMKMGVETS